jgi:gliding motility-associated-like protein
VQINLDETQCDSALINGNWHYSTKIVRDSFQTIYGCDSVIVTELVIHNSIITYANDVQCDSALINGNWYLSSKTVHDSFQTSKGCDSLHITYLSVVFPSTAVEQHTICERDSFNLPDGRIVYDPGNYRSIITNASGCDSTVYTSVLMNYTYYEPMPDTSKCLGDEITVYAGSGVDLVEYNWSDGSSGPSVVTTDIIKYQLKVTATNGCTAYDTIRVKDADCEACPVFIPTAFTPDNTGLNDDFHPVYECEFLDYRFEIFNRWGECLFHTRDPNVVWDGMYKDKAVPQDVYVWVVYYTDTRSLKPILHSGTVTLLR